MKPRSRRSSGDQTTKHAELIESIGPWPFATRRTFRRGDGLLAIWRSRHHRKDLPAPEPGETISLGATLRRCLWMPRQLNWWIGVVFAIGSLLFMLGSVLSLAPALARARSLDATAINAIFFAGSIPFTTAAYLQLFQTANADEFSPQGDGPRRGIMPFGWRPHDIGWLSSALQFAGTVAFTLIGAVGFLIGSLLMLPETVTRTNEAGVG